MVSAARAGPRHPRRSSIYVSHHRCGALVLVRTGRVAEIRLRDATQPTPRMGGVAMFTGFVAAIFLAAQLPALTRGFMPVTPEMNAVLWAALALVLVGVVDDLVELSAIVKLLASSLRPP